MIRTDLGIATAYAEAVSKGYTGTRDEFGQMFVDFGKTAEKVTEDKKAVEQMKTSVERTKNSVDTTAAEFGQNVADKTEEAKAAITEHANTEKASATADISEAKDAATGVITEAQTSATDAIAAVKDSATAEITKKGTDTLATIPEDYTTLSKDVSSLKEDLGDIVTVENTNVINITNATKGEKNGISYELSKDGMLTINGECTTNTALDLSNTVSSIEHNGKIFIGAKINSGKPPKNQQYLLVQGLLDDTYTRLFTIGYSDFDSDNKTVYVEKQVVNSVHPYSVTIFAGSYDNVKFQLFVNKDKFTYDKDGVYLNSNVNTGAVEERLKTWTDNKYEKLFDNATKVEEKVNILNASNDFESTVNGITMKYSNGVATLSGTATARASFTIAKEKTNITSGVAYVGYVVNSGSASKKIIISGLVDENYKDIVTISAKEKRNIIYQKISCSSVKPYTLSILQDTVLDNYNISLFINDRELIGENYYTLNPSIRIDSQEDNIFENIIDSPYFDSIIHCISKNTIQNVTDFSHTNLYGKKVAFVGDSFTDKNTSLYENGKSYIYYQKDIFNLTIQNLGISGSTISSFATSSNPMVLRLSSIESDANMIVLRGGVNDFLAHTPIGIYDSKNDNDFCGALNNSIKYLKENYPNAKLAFITPIYCNNCNVPNNQLFILEDYVKAMMEVCRRNEVKCYDGYHFGICDEITSNIYLKDGLHYSTNGIEAEKLIIASFLSSIIN